MNEEEKKELIRKLHTLQDSYIEEGYQGFAGVIHETINLLEKQDKIIQAIATNLVEHIGTCPIDYDDDFENEKCERCQNTYAECWIEYFTKKVGE